MTTGMIHIVGPSESIVFSQRSPLGHDAYIHLVRERERLLLLQTLPRANLERMLAIAVAETTWVVDSILRLLIPARDGGCGDDVLSVDGPGSLRLRRTAQVEDAGDPGFTLMDRGRPAPYGGFLEITWSDRMLFDAGLYRALVGIAVDWARATGHEPPLDPQARIRPHWMGARVGDTPPPPPE